MYNAPHDPSHPDTGALTLPHLDEEVSGVPLQQEDHLQHREHPRGVAGEVHLHVTAINRREYFMETEIFLTPSLVCRP